LKVMTMKNNDAEYYRMTVEKALDLARNPIYGPLPKPDAPVPSIKEAIEAIHEARGTCWHNWLTGEQAENVLREHRKRGRK